MRLPSFRWTISSPRATPLRRLAALSLVLAAAACAGTDSREPSRVDEAEGVHSRAARPPEPSSPSCVSWGPGRIDCFARGPRNTLEHIWYAGRWSRWEDLGGSLSSSPSAVSWGPGRLDVFARDGAGNLAQKYYDGSWKWANLGPPTSGYGDVAEMDSGPGCAALRDGRITCWLIATLRAPQFPRPLRSFWIRHYRPKGGWTQWYKGDNTGTIRDTPSVIAFDNSIVEYVEVFMRGAGNKLIQMDRTPNARDWIDLGGQLHSRPSCVSWGVNRIDCFARGPYNHLIHKWFANRRWSGWEDLGGTLVSAPTVASWAPGRLDIFWRSSQGRMHHMWYDGGWGGPENLGGRLY